MIDVVKSLIKPLNLYGNPDVLNIPRVLMISLNTHHGIVPVYSWYRSGVPNTPSVLNDTSFGVLNIPWCTALTLCRVIVALNSTNVQERKFC